MRKWTMTRRRFLRDLGVSAAAVPFVAGLDSLYAKAAVPAVPKQRFIMVYTANGQLYSTWRIPMAGADIDISTGAPLNSPSLNLSPLVPNAKKLLILDRLSYISARQQFQDKPNMTVDGLDHPGGHQKGMGSILTGTVLIGGSQNFGNAGMANGISLDQVIANNLFKGVVKFPSLQLAVRSGGDLDILSDRYVDKRLSYSAPNMPIAPISDPWLAFSTIFAGVTPTGGPPPMQNIQSIIDKSVLDNVTNDFTRLQTKLSSADWQILQQHQASIRNIEQQLTAVFQVAQGCTLPTPSMPAGLVTTNQAATKAWTMLVNNYPIAAGLMIDIMVQALACGLTNVVTFMFANSENDMQFPFLPTPVLKGHHGMSHARDPDLLKVDQFYAGQVNTMLTKMDAIMDSGTGKTLLDNSLLMYTSCLGDGSSHHSNNAPIVLAGSNGGYFRQGRLIRFNSVYNALTGDPQSAASINTAQLDQNNIGMPDLSNNDLCGSILDSFGILKAMPATMSDSRFYHGPLPTGTVH
jgi:hypothetical protein